MTKSRRTVSLDPDVNSYLDGEGVNASQLVNRLVRSYQSAGGDETGMLRLREQQLTSEIEELESRLDTKRDELEVIQDQLTEFRDDQASVVEEAAEKLPEHARDPENPAVENWAEKAGLPPEELLDRVESLDDDGCE